MLLRRLMTHLKDQNWFAVGLDVLVVIVGIFLGLQVSNWNDSRKERDQELAYLLRLKTDLEMDYQNYEFGLQLTDERIEQIRLLEHAINNPELARNQPGQFIGSVERSTWASSLPVEARTWEELTSSGSTLLISDVALRSGLSDYYRNIRRWDVILADLSARKNFSQATAGLLSADQLIAIEAASNDDSNEQGTIAATSDEAFQIAKNLAGNDEAIRWLPKMIHYHVLAKEVLGKRLQDTENLLALIRQEINDN